MPHRAALLASLDRYAQRRQPADARRALQVRRFVAGQPRCFERDCFDDGHVTASALVLDEHGKRGLFTLHAKLGRWLQLGGHADGNPDLLAVACREATEESGLTVVPAWAEPIDVDVHAIPAWRNEPAHQHYDVRFLLRADRAAPTVTAESLALQWVPLDAVATLTEEASILRLVAKGRQCLDALARRP